ncbi:MAG: xanthine dehydrogenase family protein molybdopterin-binding subunit [Deltaproteobacteria bacterium]|nr:xanthine dehydrogenase family protein molybdopterin-binding subunit [Deltaproteobacteria bacterium]
MKDLAVVGKSVLRVDARTKVLGKNEYCTDIKLPGMVHAKVLGSPYPHARILSIDTSDAEKVPGVCCVLTDEHAPKRLTGTGTVRDMPILARGVVRYVGEPVAAVAATTLDAAEEAVELIRVGYEELPAIFDVEQAAGTDPRIIIHPDFSAYRKTTPPERLCSDRPNVFTHIKVYKGNVDRGFKESDLIVENRFVAPSVQHCALELHAAVVRPEPDGGVTVFTGKQGISRVKEDIAAVFGMEADKIRVKQQYVGGAFGGKATIYEHIPTLLALKTGRPVKWVMTREEAFVLGGPRQGMLLIIKDGFKQDGTLVARKMEVFVDGGAYAEASAGVTQNCSAAAICMYRIPHLKWDGYAVYTNTPKRRGMRGYGVNEVTFAIESNMDIAAEKLGIDPVELRRKNLLREGEPMLNGEIIHSIGVAECLDRVCESIDLNEKSAPLGQWRKGKGLALGNKYSSPGSHYGAKIQVTENERITLYHGADAIGQGVNTVMAQVAAEEFGILPDKVDIIFSDTATAPYFGHGSTSSRTTFNLGNALRRACDDAKKQIIERAASRLEAPPEILAVRNMEVYVKSHPNRKIKVRDLFSCQESGEIVGAADYRADCIPDDPNTGQLDPSLAREGKRFMAFYAYAAKAVEVGVNIETGEVKVLRCHSAIDLGKAINPKICEQQSEGGMAMGIGSALYEETLMENGRVLNPNLMDYRIPLAAQMPANDEMKSIFVESAPHKDGPFGAKGFAEGVVTGMEPAIANAVYNAVGVRIKALPITPEKVIMALREKQPF